MLLEDKKIYTLPPSRGGDLKLPFLAYSKPRFNISQCKNTISLAVTVALIGSCYYQETTIVHHIPTFHLRASEDHNPIEGAFKWKRSV